MNHPSRRIVWQLLAVLALAIGTLTATVPVERGVSLLESMASLDAASDAELEVLESRLAGIDDAARLRALVVAEARKDAAAARVTQALGENLRVAGIAIVALQVAAMFLLTLTLLGLRRRPAAPER